mmetsp:Transcript_26480/g.66338  ORF Transcript_26480/g.66338 Transcript_26480/m.66338 type:complete len:259 (-) Transcript_26480:481-1257(-)
MRDERPVRGDLFAYHGVHDILQVWITFSHRFTLIRNAEPADPLVFSSAASRRASRTMNMTSVLRLIHLNKCLCSVPYKPWRLKPSTPQPETARRGRQNNFPKSPSKNPPSFLRSIPRVASSFTSPDTRFARSCFRSPEVSSSIHTMSFASSARIFGEVLRASLRHQTMSLRCCALHSSSSFSSSRQRDERIIRGSDTPPVTSEPGSLKRASRRGSRVSESAAMTIRTTQLCSMFAMGLSRNTPRHTGIAPIIWIASST